MNTITPELTEFDGARWKAVRLGLRLANNHLGGIAMGCFYALWGVIGVLLSLFLIPVALLGKMDAFKETLNLAALYGLVWPMALMATATWSVKFVSRLLWCGIPGPVTATALAIVAVAGRLCLLLALGSVWFSAGPFLKGLLQPEMLACAALAGLGLWAEWAFVRTLRHHDAAAPDPARSCTGPAEGVRDQTEAEFGARQQKRSLLTRDLGDWFKERFPKASKVVGWILLPLAYVVLASLAGDGNPQAVPEALLRLAVLAPAFLQIFWVPSRALDELIAALAPGTMPQRVRPT